MPVYLEYGNKLSWTCYRVTGVCFKCGKTDHLVRDCPQRDRQNGNRTTTSLVGSTPALTIKIAAKPINTRDNARQGRVFALILGDVQNTEAMVSGTFSFDGHSTHVLFDSSSTHLFVSKTFASHLNSPMEPFYYVLCVSSPLGDSMLCKFIYLACEILIGDVQLYANLLSLDMAHSDIILGMDWLSKYHMTIESDVCVDNIPTVCEFPDVFPEELLGELVDCEIEFAIDVVPRTQPI
ncbi:uncharacterized protein LOC114272658 [Camellia sinensis]|uniref:uncharacterized protein LOC114272658 n=1 Tax=Camellia sinensis TaxID=4442 RepID=UPI001035BFCD|nr:uncharacterized protein LOC114272658 [Camellia sinensis]